MHRHYFRITAYHPKENITAILDSYGFFRKQKNLSFCLTAKDFEIVESGTARKFLDGSFPKIPYDPSHFYLQAIHNGKPAYTEYSLNGKVYKAIQVDNRIYIPNKKKRV